MRVLAGVLPPTSGRVVDRRASTTPPTPAAHGPLVGYCPDVGGLVPRATPWEHLHLAARLRGMTAVGGAGRATCSSGSTWPPPQTG